LPNDIYFSWQPKPLYLGAETTFTAVVGGGVAPFIYTWTFGDDGTAVGNPVTHTFTVSGTIPVTLMVTNDYGASTPMIKPVIVWQPGTVPYYIYSPVILKQEP
jgi:PKD repeat protein